MYILWFFSTKMILVSDFRNLTMGTKKAIKNDQKYIYF